MRNCRRIVFLRFLSRIARKNRSADSYRLNELLAIKFDSFSLQIKAFARASAGQQSAVIRDMADNFYIFNDSETPAAVQPDEETAWRFAQKLRRIPARAGLQSVRPQNF